ncbi:hypothetical protein M0R45_014424 [Rubus argutus]|uniref:Uncharacterized protein n=1 Tax=Rubus argutus TaxID=59490 RepID=A0AAW1XLJ9_RUBAR
MLQQQYLPGCGDEWGEFRRGVALWISTLVEYLRHRGGGYAGFVGSPAADDLDDGFGSGKRKGSGIKMFGDLWRKKGQK